MIDNESNVTSTVEASTLGSFPITTTTRIITTTLSSTTPSSSPTSSTTQIDLNIILPCTIIGGVMLIVFIVICICYKKRQRLKQKNSPPTLPSFAVPKLNDISNESPIDHQQEEAIKPVLLRNRHISNTPVAETRESMASVTSVYSDGYIVPSSPPNKEIQDDPEYIDMTQPQYLPKACGVVNKGYVNDPRNPQTNFFSIHELSSHYQNTGNSVPDMRPIKTVSEYANIKNEISESTKRPSSDIYENTDQILEDHQLLDYENAPAKVTSKNENINESLTTNNLTPEIKPKKTPPSPRTNRPQLSLQNNSPKPSVGSPRSQSSPRGSPRSRSSPRGSPASKTPRTCPEKYRGVKVM
ncbi:hypothetical protein LOTGIDRAFT_232713 [Lottia gigantea]|uniref:Uncharacterized protein n=1 Tax=Lottia gigantea TaxID=225164 RepID=V4AIG8_LOTGI|nr:hypothetical protein LOTGIDRAFT_232713 [Lottia gigantea]ESO93271.1 hypothetical protein LOTGIDRAFT_232713 [Lottia gigantea]